VSGLPSGWTSACIEDVLDPLDDGRLLHQGWSPRCEKVPSESDGRWGVLKTTAIQAGAFHPEHNKALPMHLIPRPLIEVHPGDILITCAGPRARCGVSCLVVKTRPRLMMSGKMYRFRVSDRYVSSRFVSFYLQTASAWADIDRMKTGGSDSGLNLTQDRFSRLQLPVAPTAEQGRIVASIEEQFSRLDVGVAALRRVRQNLNRMRAAVLHRAISETALRKYDLSSFGAVLREPLRNGHSARGDPLGTVPVLTLTAVTLGDFSDRNMKMTAADPRRIRDLWIQPGDILIERSNTRELVGTARLYRGPSSVAVYPDLIIRARVKDTVLPEYAELVLQSPNSRRYFQQCAQGISGTMPKIDQGVIERLPFPVPARSVQAAIVADTERWMTVLDVLEGELVTGSL
jgi:type I restriction enzyme S subunit